MARGKLPPPPPPPPPNVSASSPKDFVNDFFLNTDTSSLEVKFMLQNSKVHFHMRMCLLCIIYISPCTLCKIFALRVGPSHTYLKLPPKKKFSTHTVVSLFRKFTGKILAIVRAVSRIFYILRQRETDIYYR